MDQLRTSMDAVRLAHSTRTHLVPITACVIIIIIITIIIIKFMYAVMFEWKFWLEQLAKKHRRTKQPLPWLA